MSRRKNKKWVLIGLVLLLLMITAFVIYVLIQQQRRETSADTLTLEQTDYSAADKITEALEKLEDNPEKAGVITDINTIDKEVGICFEGTADSRLIQQILDELKAHDIHATFFISAVDVGEDTSVVNSILQSGHDLGSYTLHGTPHMEMLTREELVEDFCRAQVVYEDKIGITPTILKCNATDQTQDILETAAVSGYDRVLYPTHYLNYASFSNQEMAQNYVRNVEKGSIITVKMNGYLDKLEYEEDKKEAKPAKDKQAGLNLYQQEDENLSEDERLLQVVKWLLDALDEEGYKTVPISTFPSQDMGDLAAQYEVMEEQYQDEMAEIITAVHTTDRETAFIFRGLGDTEELTNVLAVLQEIGATATFFVTGEEIDRYPDQIQQILDAGCEIGNGGYLGKDMKEMSFGEICEDIYKNDLVLADVGVESDLFMPPYGVITEEVQMAAAAMGKKLILYNSSPTRTEYVQKKYTGQEVVREYYSDSRLVLCRGDITYFNMKVYEETKDTADLVRAVYQYKVLPTDYGKQKDHILQVCSVSQLLDHTWSYPAATNVTYNAVGTSGRMQSAIEQMLQEGYIGNPYLELGGFAEEELAILDRTGRINTGGSNTVFLTFDDWGNEATIGKVLYVLDKHNVKATFFIKTEYVMDGSSENLLRAIAEKGHDVASHTHTHMTIDITQDLVPVLQRDLVKSNQVLSNVVGDTGRLTDYFRPPTLAVNKLGVGTVFDCGFGYIVNADISTGDYDAGSVEEVYDTLLNGVRLDSGERMTIQDGSIIVMHINTHSIYTAQGLDRYLNYVESLPDGDPGKFHFARLSDYLK
ncbi:MAG: polysaccharide deacetylase family protein [Lachnospiraceae bacterium]